MPLRLESQELVIVMNGRNAKITEAVGYLILLSNSQEPMASKI
jgi:hypothetical protein